MNLTGKINKNIEELNKIYSNLDRKCKKYGITGWHRYGPIDPQKYFLSKRKILIINSESVGFSDTGVVPAKEVLNWFDYNTILNSALVSYILNIYIATFQETNKMKRFKKSFFTETRKNIDLIKNNFCTVAYMNTRVSSNDTGSFKEDTESVSDEITLFHKFRVDLIKLIQPDIIIVGGKQSRKAITELYKKDENFFKPNSVVSEKNQLLLFFNHLGNFGLFNGYKGIHKILIESVKIMSKMGQL